MPVVAAVSVNTNRTVTHLPAATYFDGQALTRVTSVMVGVYAVQGSPIALKLSRTMG